MTSLDGRAGIPRSPWTAPVGNKLLTTASHCKTIDVIEKSVNN